jgi:hypothetical protein
VWLPAILAGVFSLDEARKQLATVRPRIDQVLALRADLAELRADIAAGRPSTLGNLADAKAWEAQLFAQLEAFAETGAVVKGFAPLLLDYPGERDGEAVLWCWLEGEPDIMWYHRLDCGFPGRRRV